LKKLTRKLPRLKKARTLPGVILTVGLLALASYCLGWSQLLAVKAVDIHAGDQGTLVTSTVVPADVKLGEPLARIDIARIHRDISQFSWVSSIQISRNWLTHKVSINVVARKPVATFVSADGASHYLDAQGVDFQLPIAVSSIPAISFASVDANSEKLAAGVVSQLPTDLVQGMRSLAISSKSSAIMVTTLAGFSNLTIIWGDQSQIPLKVNVLRHLLQLPENKKTIQIDISSPLAPLVK
jgi:cell division protein FtsQ